MTPLENDKLQVCLSPCFPDVQNYEIIFTYHCSLLQLMSLVISTCVIKLPLNLDGSNSKGILNQFKLTSNQFKPD